MSTPTAPQLRPPPYECANNADNTNIDNNASIIATYSKLIDIEKNLKLIKKDINWLKESFTAQWIVQALIYACIIFLIVWIVQKI